MKCLKLDIITNQLVEADCDFIPQKGEYTKFTNILKIAQLKSDLTATDYKIIKCSEYQLTGKPMPYDVAALHAERQALRDRINTLEASLITAQ